jgi:hypothetical protein
LFLPRGGGRIGAGEKWAALWSASCYSCALVASFGHQLWYYYLLLVAWGLVTLLQFFKLSYLFAGLKLKKKSTQQANKTKT